MRKLFLSLGIIVLISGIIASFIFYKKSSKKENNETIISVSTLQPVETSLQIPIETFGTVTYKSKNEITNLYSGTVIEKNKKNSDFVKKGDILYKLKNVELEMNYNQCLNNLNTSLANLELLKAQLCENEKTVQSHIIQIQNMEAELNQLNKELNSANEKLSNNIEINKLGGLSNQTIKDMEETISALSVSIGIKEKEIESMSLGYSKKALIDAGIPPSENKEEYYKQLILLNTKTSQANLKIAEAEYENAKNSLIFAEKMIEELTIRSPISGIIGVTYFEEGEYVKANEKLLTLMNTSICRATIDLQEEEITSIKAGTKVSIDIPSLNKNVSSTITEISPVIDSTTGHFFIHSDFENNNNLIKPGMFVKCRIEKQIENKYLQIPESAAFNIQDTKAFCFIVKNNTAIQKQLKINQIANGNLYLSEGIKSDDIVIDNPSNRLKDGTRVKVL